MIVERHTFFTRKGWITRSGWNDRGRDFVGGDSRSFDIEVIIALKGEEKGKGKGKMRYGYRQGGGIALYSRILWYLSLTDHTKMHFLMLLPVAGFGFGLDGSDAGAALDMCTR